MELDCKKTVYNMKKEAMKTYGSLREYFGAMKNKTEYRYAQQMTIGMPCYNPLYF